MPTVNSLKKNTAKLISDIDDFFKKDVTNPYTLLTDLAKILTITGNAILGELKIIGTILKGAGKILEGYVKHKEKKK